MKKSKSPVSLIMIDIDNFKSINDTYGHIAGDKVLKQISAIFKQSIRISDVLVRWGGEEFAVILPDADNQKAIVIAERIRNAVEKGHFDYEITVSIGVTSTDEEVDVDKFTKLADQALYKAKEKKNSVASIGSFMYSK